MHDVCWNNVYTLCTSPCMHICIIFESSIIAIGTWSEFIKLYNVSMSGYYAYSILYLHGFNLLVTMHAVADFWKGFLICWRVSWERTGKQTKQVINFCNPIFSLNTAPLSFSHIICNYRNKVSQYDCSIRESRTDCSIHWEYLNSTT